MKKPERRHLLLVLWIFPVIFLVTGHIALFSLSALYAAIIHFWTRPSDEQTDRPILQPEEDPVKSIPSSENPPVAPVVPQQAIMESNARFAGGVAHDLNNILSGMITYPELLLMDLPEDSPLRKPLESIKRSGLRAADVISDLVTISKGLTGEKLVLNINTVVKAFFSSQTFRDLDEKSPNILIGVDLSPQLLNAVGSDTHITTIVRNLLVHGIEAVMDEGKVMIRTDNLYLDTPDLSLPGIPPGEYVTLSVTDTGLHIPQKDLAKIFEPYYCKKVLERSCSGLGLAIVWNMVRDSGGFIFAKSGENGSEYTVYFPASRSSLGISQNRDSDTQGLVGNGEMVLIVDDDELQREIATAILQKAGYDVRSVSSGEKAIEFLQNGHADLIVLDMIMAPGINGYETYKRITAFRPGQKAIIASGFVRSTDVDNAQKLGAGRYVRKPYTVSELLCAVKSELTCTAPCPTLPN
jgi:signal transduction histidine kinase/ActR/RegA family two-component response regulator